MNVNSRPAVFCHDVELSESRFPLTSMLACVRAHAKLGVGLHDMKLGVTVCDIVAYTVRRSIANMGTDMVPPVPNNVFKLASDDLVGTLGSAMKL